MHTDIPLIDTLLTELCQIGDALQHVVPSCEEHAKLEKDKTQCIASVNYPFTQSDEWASDFTDSCLLLRLTPSPSV